MVVIQQHRETAASQPEKSRPSGPNGSPAGSCPSRLSHPVQVQVVTELRLGSRCLHTRLIGVDFPGMEIEHHRLPLNAVDPREHPLWRRGRATVGSSPPPLAGKLRSRNRKVVIGISIRPEASRWRETRRVGHAVMIMSDRIDAGTVCIAGARQRIRMPTGCVRRWKNSGHDSPSPRRRRTSSSKDLAPEMSEKKSASERLDAR